MALKNTNKDLCQKKVVEEYMRIVAFKCVHCFVNGETDTSQ